MQFSHRIMRVARIGRSRIIRLDFTYTYSDFSPDADIYLAISSRYNRSRNIALGL